MLHWPFGVAWAGTGVAMVGAGNLLWARAEPVADVLQQVGLCICVVGIVAAFWLPAVLLPAWYRAAKSDTGPGRGVGGR
ncbi:hypothetical protein ABID92_000688 [Frigoribacterium sp. PvP120]|uniref:hypothetical protein n=1 Tax=unclassified Frigoribacterium TaxID=2627005 RepID=UPI001AE77ED1|nr:hypothetical protein [Frigoribacterium sp. PvP121]MBP1241483.1 hypothetical protein [Frigoribacterium sp. PvP121]